MTLIQVSQETGKVNYPQFVVIHTVKGFSVVNEAEVDVFLEFSCFFCYPVNVGNLISGSSAFSIIQLVNLEVLGSHTVEGFEGLPC